MSRSLISVIITHYKIEEFTKEAVMSVVRQKGFNKSKIEIIISSEIYNKELFSRFRSIDSRVKCFSNKNNHGPGHNRENGLKHANGKYVLFLDADDRLEENFLKNSYQQLCDDENIVSTLCLTSFIFESGFTLDKKIKISILNQIKNFSLQITFLLREGYLGPNSFYLCQLSHMLFRRNVIDNIHFNSDYSYGGEDWDYVIQAMQYGKVKIIPIKMLVFRYSSRSVSQTTSKNNQKKKSYQLLCSRLPSNVKTGLMYRLFDYYYNHFII